MKIVQHLLPSYTCHKRVHALQIRNVIVDNDGISAMLTFKDESFPPVNVNNEWLKKHRPTASGYYVVYEDGYISFSPKKAFESGYTRDE